MSRIINATPHDCTFQSKSGEVYTVKPCGMVINAKIEEEFVKEDNGVEFVKSTFVSDAENMSKVEFMEKVCPNDIIVGSIIAAQAFPGRVFGMVAVTGYERVPADQKRMRDDKFVTF